RALRRHGTNLLHYQSGHPLGLPVLRRSLAAYLREARGVRCDWRNIAITTGSQHALFLLAELLLTPGDRVLIEDPGYLGARRAFERVPARMVSLAVGDQGANVSTPDAARGVLMYLTPSRQFPTGACLPIARRLALVDLAAKSRIWIVEDDYDSEF